MIADDAGQPVWFQPLPGIQAATDFRAQTYKGKPVLTYWQGTSRQGIGVGEMVVLDQSYRVIRRIRTANGFRPDLHEFKHHAQGHRDPHHLSGRAHGPAARSRARAAASPSTR